jgi:hypothetical protein
MRGSDQWLYPHAVTPLLADARGESWRELTQYLAPLEEEHEDCLAFSLMMIRLCGCVSCQPGGYRLSLGCGTCAFRTVANVKGSDIHLLKEYNAARHEVLQFLGLGGDEL